MTPAALWGHLCALAWSDTDLVGDLLPSRDNAALIRHSIQQAADVVGCTDEAVIAEACAQLAREVDLYLRRVEQDAADQLADEVQAGDRREDGSFVEWPRYP